VLPIQTPLRLQNTSAHNKTVTQKRLRFKWCFMVS
jgi:hypothetical protein